MALVIQRINKKIRIKIYSNIDFNAVINLFAAVPPRNLPLAASYGCLATQMPKTPTLSMYQHTRRLDNGFGSRCSLLVFKSTLKSPFSKNIHTAIPPPAALCDFKSMLTTLSQRFFMLVLLYYAKACLVNITGYCGLEWEV